MGKPMLIIAEDVEGEALELRRDIPARATSLYIPA